MSRRPALLFVSPRFLFPLDSGGRIRTTEILRNMKGGAFEITLATPATPDELTRHAGELEQVCDHLVSWAPTAPGPLAGVTRMRHIASSLPIPVATDRSAAASRVIAAELAKGYAVAVFDFIHAAVLAPDRFGDTASVMFTHNVEAEIFGRHAEVARDPLRGWVWNNQHRKMQRFEAATLKRFDRAVAVSDRDREIFARDYGVDHARTIPTGVNLDFFAYNAPPASDELVFIGSMDWLANIDAMEFMMDDIWSGVAARVPGARMKVVGKSPPEGLVRRAKERGLAWEFTGRVDDIRPHVAQAAACVIPIRVGGGTRIKAFESMAMGSPLISTTIGVEGLDVKPGVHYLRADTAQEFADAAVALLQDPALGRRLAESARAHVEANYSNAVVGRHFEQICLEAREFRAKASNPSG